MKSEAQNKAEQAAKDFGEQLPLFKALAQNMSKKQVNRVFAAILEFPLQEGPVKFKTKEEQTLFISGLTILDAKLVMYSASLEDNAQKKEENNEQKKMD